MQKVIGRVRSCVQCPRRAYYSGGTYECSEVQQPLPRDHNHIPEWCPLPNDSSAVAASALARLDNAKQVLLAAEKEAQTAPIERLRELISIAAAQVSA